MTTRRTFVAAAGAMLAAPRLARAWEPSRPIQLIVGFPPGGGADLAARAAAEASTRFFPTPLVVINRPGAGGAIAAQQMTTTTPDGLNLLVNGGSESTSLPAFRDVPYIPLGQMIASTVFRREIVDIPKGFVLFWSTRRA